MNKFISYQNQYVNKISDAINRNLDDFVQSVDSHSKILSPFFREFVKASQGGKRIRADLVLLSYQLFGGQNVEDVIDISSALEIWQTGVLAKDDIIDNSSTRRGRPSLHCALGGNHGAVSQTICLGDLGMGDIPNSIILDSNFANDKKIETLRCFNNTYNHNTMLGQMLDIELSNMTTCTLEDTMKMYHLKTANYTVIGPMQIGAILAGASKEDLELIQNFGTEVGVMFQLGDDLLGVFGNEEKTGKPTTSDIKEGKKTPLSLYAFENANVNDLELLTNIYGRIDHEIIEEDINMVRTIFIRSGALQYVEDLIANSKNCAESLMQTFPSNEFKDILADFVEYMSKIYERNA